MTIRRRIYLILEPTEKGDILERIFEWILLTIIILNILAIVCESIQEVHEQYADLFYKFELFSVVFFTLEYILRIYSIVESKKYSNQVFGRLKYMGTPMALIDLMAFFPFYLSFLPLDLRFLRIFRLMGLFRMFKIARYMHALSMFKKVIYDRREQLVLSIIFILFILVIISTTMFYVERKPSPRNLVAFRPPCGGELQP